MTELIVIIALLGYIAWKEWTNQKQVKKLIELSMAKDLNELKTFESKPVVVKETRAELTPIEQVSTEEFDDAIKMSLGKESLVHRMKRRLSG